MRIRSSTAAASRTPADGPRWRSVASVARRFVLFVLLLTAASVQASPSGEEDAASPQRLTLQFRNSLRHYGYDDGLPQASVNAILRGHDGFLWLGTFGGLVRFDGKEFRVFRSRERGRAGEGISSERVLSLYEDVHGRLWVGTQEGGVGFYEKGRFRHLPVCGDTCMVNRLFSIDGRFVWVLAGNGVYRVDVETLESTMYLSAFDAYPVYAVAHGEAFVAGAAGFARLSAGGLRPVALPDGHAVVRKIASDGDAVWIIVQNGSLYRYDPAREHWTFIRGGLRSEAHLLADGSGHVYLSDEAAGMRRLGSDGTEQSLDSPQLLHASTAYADGDGSLWIGSTSKGLWRLRPARVALLRSSLAGSSPGRVIASDGADGVWLVHGCSDLWHRAADGHQVRWPTTAALADQCVVSLAYDAASDTLWIGSSGSTLARLKDGRLEKLASWERTAEIGVWKIRGELWVASVRFVGRLRLQHDGSFAGVDEIPGLAGMNATAITEARGGGVWVAGDRGAFRVVGDEVVERWTPNEGIRGGHFRALHEDEDGSLWIGTYGSGLVRIRDGIVRQYTEADGLFDDTVSCILPDAEGRLWMAGNRGISRLVDRDIGAGGPRVVTLTASDGLDPPEFNGGTAPPCTADGKGRLWFAMVVGFAMVDPAALPSPSGPHVPVAYIDHASVSGRRLDLDTPEDLDPGSANLEIGFGAVDLVEPAKVRFRYRIGGERADWVEAGSGRSLLLPSVPWGELVFEVQAREQGGDWSRPAVLRLDRPVPWYRHQWIWLAASLGSLLGLLWMTRERRRPELDDFLEARLRRDDPR